MLSPKADLKNQVLVKAAGCPVNSTTPRIVTAGGAGDNTAVTGVTIDRLGYDAAVLAVACQVGALTTDKVLTLAMEYQDSADDSTWSTAVPLQAATTALSAVGSTVVSYGLNLKGLKRYIRLNYTPNLTADNTDVASCFGFVVLSGSDSLPAA